MATVAVASLSDRIDRYFQLYETEIVIHGRKGQMTEEAVQEALKAASKYVTACRQMSHLEINTHIVEKESREYKLYEAASKDMSDALAEMGQMRLSIQFKNYA